jgi:hypothetical protein
MKRNLVMLCLCVLTITQVGAKDREGITMNFFPANNPNIQYTGRIDFSNPLLPRFWQPGVYIETKFIGAIVPSF